MVHPLLRCFKLRASNLRFPRDPRPNRPSAIEALNHPFLKAAPSVAASAARSLGSALETTVGSAAAATSTVLTTAGKSLGKTLEGAGLKDMVRHGREGDAPCLWMWHACSLLCGV